MQKNNTFSVDSSNQWLWLAHDGFLLELSRNVPILLVDRFHRPDGEEKCQREGQCLPRVGTLPFHRVDPVEDPVADVRLDHRPVLEHVRKFINLTATKERQVLRSFGHELHRVGGWCVGMKARAAALFVVVTCK